MAVRTRTIYGFIRKPASLEPLKFATVRFALTGIGSFTEDTYFDGNEFEATTNADGRFEKELWANVDGGDCHYTVTFPDGGKYSFDLPYGDGSDVRIDAILGLSVSATGTVLTYVQGYLDETVEPRLIPAGGTTGQALLKASNTNFDTVWGNVAGGGSAPNYFRSITPPPSNGYTQRFPLVGTATYTNNGFNLVVPVASGDANYRSSSLCRTFDRTKRQTIGIVNPFEPSGAEYSGPVVGLNLPCEGGNTFYLFGQTGFFSSAMRIAPGNFADNIVPVSSNGSYVIPVPGPQFYIVEPYSSGVRVWLSPDGYAPGTLLFSDGLDRGWSHIGVFAAVNNTCSSDARVRFFHDTEENL